MPRPRPCQVGSWLSRLVTCVIAKTKTRSKKSSSGVTLSSCSTWPPGSIPGACSAGLSAVGVLTATDNRRARRPPGRRASALDHADRVALRVLEHADLDVLHDLLRAHHTGAAEALGLRQRRFHVRHLDVEGDVALIAVGPLADAAADPDPVGVRVLIAWDDAVVHRVVCVHLPA